MGPDAADFSMAAGDGRASVARVLYSRTSCFAAEGKYGMPTNHGAATDKSCISCRLQLFMKYGPGPVLCQVNSPDAWVTDISCLALFNQIMRTTN